jgi:hypothetical protein
MKESESIYTQIGLSLPDSQQSQMFGKPCFKIGGKAYISLFEGCMIFKLNGEARTDALALDGAAPFDPSKKGRPMKEWIQLPFGYQDMWPHFAEAAQQYVRSLLEKK